MAESEASGSGAEQDGLPLVTVTVSSLSGRCCDIQLSAKDTVEMLRDEVASVWDMVAQQLELIADVTVPHLDDFALRHGTEWTARVTYQSVRSMLDTFLTEHCEATAQGGLCGSPAATTDCCDGEWPEATGPAFRDLLGSLEPDDALHVPANSPADALGNAIGLLGGVGAAARQTRTGRRRRALHRRQAQAQTPAPAQVGNASSCHGYAYTGPPGGDFGLPVAVAAVGSWSLPAWNPHVSAAGTFGLPIVSAVGTAAGTHMPQYSGGAAWGLPLPGTMGEGVPASNAHQGLLISNSTF